jgi:hypothetical protein
MNKAYRTRRDWDMAAKLAASSVDEPRHCFLCHRERPYIRGNNVVVI